MFSNTCAHMLILQSQELLSAFRQKSQQKLKTSPNNSGCLCEFELVQNVLEEVALLVWVCPFARWRTTKIRKGTTNGGYQDKDANPTTDAKGLHWFPFLFLSCLLLLLVT